MCPFSHTVTLKLCMHTALDGTEFLIENGLGVAQKAEPAPHSTTQQRYAVVVVVVECCFTSTETVGLLGTGAQDVHLDFHRWWWWWLKAFIIYMVLFSAPEQTRCTLVVCDFQ